MDSTHRLSPARRSDALGRLRAITAGVAVAGVAATAGFGVAAANGDRGTNTAGASPGHRATVAPGNDPASNGQLPAGQPPGGGTFQDPGFGGGAGVQPPTRASRPGHASTGGSG